MGIDFILASASPGISLPQLAVIASGLALSAGAWRARRLDVDGRRARGFLVKAAVISLLTLLAIEVALTAMDAPLYHAPLDELIELEKAPFWTCDNLGCHFIFEEAVKACSAGAASGRNCIVNRQGFADSQDFVFIAEDFYPQRIMVLGDSFTHGYTADIGHSYVETMEALLPDSLIWNTGIRGSGTHQAIATFEAFAPRMQPQLTILGFVMNDFSDNLAPLNGTFTVTVPQDRTFGNPLYDGYLNVRRSVVDRWGIGRELDPRLHYSYRAAGLKPPINEFERLLGETRLGSLALRLFDRLAKLALPPPGQAQVTATRQALMDLRDEVSRQDSALLVVVIPFRADLIDETTRYGTAISLFQELGLPYMEVRDQLRASDYFNPDNPLESHWTNPGHAKVGALLADCVRAFFASGNLADCEHVVMP